MKTRLTSAIFLFVLSLAAITTSSSAQETAPAAPATSAAEPAATPAATTTTTTPAPEPLEPAVEPIAFVDFLTSGGYLMIPLGILSLFASTLILFYFFAIRRRRVVSFKFMRTADAMLRKKDYLGLVAACHRHDESISRIVSKTLEFLMKNPHAGMREAREIAETEGSHQASLLSRRISYLADVGAIAPMVGLLGTVIGMIKAFHFIGNDVAGVKPMLLAGGVAEALITTAGGLVIGIPALIFYAFFRGRVQQLISEMENATTQFIAQLEAVYHSSLSQSAASTSTKTQAEPQESIAN